MTTGDSIRECLISPNVPDSNMEPANVVDVIAGAGQNIARAIDRASLAHAQALREVALAIHALASATRGQP